MEEKELISVIIPIYNAEKYLRQCLESVINQTYKQLEIILVNDGSTDGSLSVCYEYQKKDSRIIIISQQNEGAFKARKNAIKIANGKYVAFVDGDDWIDQNMYYDLLKIMKENDTLMVESGIIDVNGKNERKKIAKIEEGHYKGEEFVNKILPYMLYDGIFFESLIPATLWNKLFITDIVRKLFNIIQDGGKMANDTVITYPYLVNNNDIYVTHNCYYHYRVVNGSITRNNYSDIIDKVNVHIDVMKKFFLESKYKDELMTQLYMHKMRMYAWFCPEVFDLISNKLLSIYGGIKKDEKVVIYGAGKSGVKAYSYVYKYMKNNIVAWVDGNYEFLSKEIDENIKNPTEINYKKVDKVIITVLNADSVASIKRMLKDNGVDEYKISWVPQEYIQNPMYVLDKIDSARKNIEI